MVKVYDPYEKYGLNRVINAATSLTLLGGSMPHPDVFEAMEARDRATNSSADYLLGTPLLPDYLEEGMSAMGYAPEDLEKA